MIRGTLILSTLVLALSGTQPQAQTTQGPVFDDQAFHPFILPRGSLEYAYVLQRKQAKAPAAATLAPSLAAALTRCDAYSPLSQSTRERCEIKARQTARRD